MHPACFFLTPLMIVTAEMQNAVDQEHHELLVKRSLALFGLAGCSRHGNHHVTEQLCRRMQRLPRGEGEHVGRAILASIPTIEAPHPLITHEHDAELRRSFPDIGKNRSCQSIQVRLVKRETSNLALHMDRH
jgi:hypothetical protein